MPAMVRSPWDENFVPLPGFLSMPVGFKHGQAIFPARGALQPHTTASSKAQSTPPPRTHTQHCQEQQVQGLRSIL